MEREVATSEWDRPHAYREVSLARSECRCGREKEDQLHSVVLLPEHAAVRPIVVTEKGI